MLFYTLITARCQLPLELPHGLLWRYLLYLQLVIAMMPLKV